jgi:signal transduction histidine kinase
MTEDGRHLWRVCISDRGHGVPDEKKAFLFQKFVRLKPDSKTPGTGLGLSICRALVDKFGGRIWVEDRVSGKSELGARFCVSLPAAKGN